MRRLALTALLSPALALAQPTDTGLEAESLGAAADTTVADASQTARSRVFAWGRAVEEAKRRADAVEGVVPEIVEVPAEAAAAPQVHLFGQTGLRVTLPPGWEGPVSALEAGLPDYAEYTFRNAAPGHPLEGAVLRVERISGLNALFRERFRRGQTTYGYHGAMPVGPAATPGSGFGVEVEGYGVGGATAFAEGRSGMWALSVQAPAAVWASRPGDVLAVLAGVRRP